MQTTIYEMNFNGGMRKVDQTANTNLEPGTVLHWGGNYGYSERDYCILKKSGNGYMCFDVDHPDDNEGLHYTETFSIKDPKDPDVWHSQHMFLTGETVDPETVEKYRAMHVEQAKAKQEREDNARAEADRLEAEGRALWPRLIGDCPAVIVAEHRVDDSDSQIDYFSSHATQRVILAPSKHTRDLFPEMRKAAALLPETAHLGPGCGHFSPYVAVGQDFIDGTCFYKGQHSPWHRDMDHDETGNAYIFTTREEAQAHIDKMGEPHSITMREAGEIPFTWEIGEDDIEHREKYSMGAGYYLGHPYHRGGWKVEKHTLYKGEPQRQDYIDLARRHDHLTKESAKPAPKAPANSEPSESTATDYRVEYDRDWTWIYFPAKPAEEIRETMKANGGHWSKRRAGWYFTAHMEAAQVAEMLGASQNDAPQPKPIEEKEPETMPKTDPLIEKFREMADKMTDKIEDMRAPMSQNYTPRRHAQHMSKLSDADHLERTQKALYALADAREAGTLPPVLESLKSKSAIHELLYTRHANHGYYDVVDTGELTDKSPEGLALADLLGGESDEAKARRETERLNAKAKNMIGQVPGYFPTPPAVVENMLDIAGVEAGMEVLEPSAGSGNIAEAIRARGANIDTIEINYSLVEILESKGFTPERADFLTMSPNGKRYDAVIMNPPFENKQDVKHVQHAFEFLNDGGVLVSVMAEGTFFRADCEDFREWLSAHGYDEDLPEGAFKESGTGVKTRLVILHK